MITHYIEEAEQLCNRFIFIKDGEIIRDVNRKQIRYQQKEHVFTLKDGTQVEVDSTDVSNYFVNNYQQIAHYDAIQEYSLKTIYRDIYAEEGDDNE